MTHSPLGKDILRNFVVEVCSSPTNWIMTDYAEEFITSVREEVGPEGHVIGAVSGGVDSTVAAVLMNKAIGDRFHAVMVDNGCLRKDEATKVLKRLREDCGINLTCIDASQLFLGKLKVSAFLPFFASGLFLFHPLPSVTSPPPPTPTPSRALRSSF